MRLAGSLGDWHAELLEVTNIENSFAIVNIGKEKGRTGLFLRYLS